MVIRTGLSFPLHHQNIEFDHGQKCVGNQRELIYLLHTTLCPSIPLAQFKLVTSKFFEEDKAIPLNLATAQFVEKKLYWEVRIELSGLSNFTEFSNSAVC